MMKGKTAIWRGLVENIIAEKRLSHTDVRIQGTSGNWLRVIIDISNFNGEFHFIATDAQEARDIYDSINEDKVWMLEQCKRKNEKIVRLVNTAIVRRIGMRQNE